MFSPIPPGISLERAGQERGAAPELIAGRRAHPERVSWAGFGMWVSRLLGIVPCPTSLSHRWHHVALGHLSQSSPRCQMKAAGAVRLLPVAELPLHDLGQVSAASAPSAGPAVPLPCLNVARVCSARGGPRAGLCTS